MTDRNAGSDAETNPAADPAMAALARKLRLARLSTWISYWVVLASILAGGLSGGTPTILLVFSLLPLLIFIPGMRREKHKSLALLCFVTLFYFTVLVVELGKPGYNWFDIIALAAVVILFTSAMMFSRWIQYYRAGIAP